MRGWRDNPMADATRAFQENDVVLPNGLKIHYYEWPGPRPNLVLLHPSSGYGRMWEATAGALAYLRTARPRDQEASLRHRLEHNFVAAGAGVAVRYDKVRVALGLAHMADDLRKYAARATCPVAILRGTHTSELTLDQAKEIAGCWKNAVVIDIEGDYALQMENPTGLAQALSSFAAQAVRE